jgi:hypothetical protein
MQTEVWGTNMEFVASPFVGEMKLVQMLNAGFATSRRDLSLPVGRLRHEKTPSGTGATGGTEEANRAPDR